MNDEKNKDFITFTLTLVSISDRWKLAPREEL